MRKEGEKMETYRNLLEQMKTVRPGKECRDLHRKLRKYGTGLCFRDRYPNFDLSVAVIALVVSLTVLVLKCLGV